MCVCTRMIYKAWIGQETGKLEIFPAWKKRMCTNWTGMHKQTQKEAGGSQLIVLFSGKGWSLRRTGRA